MKTFYFNDVTDFADHLSEMVDGLSSTSDIGIVLPPYQAMSLMEELIKHEFSIGSVNISDPEFCDYYDPYYISIYEGNLFCIPFKNENTDEYMHVTDTVVYISNDCNSSILKHVESDVVYAYELDEADVDEDCDDCELKDQCEKQETSLYKVNDKVVSKAEYDEAVKKIDDKYLDGITTMLSGYSGFLNEIQKLTEMFK